MRYVFLVVGGLCFLRAAAQFETPDSLTEANRREYKYASIQINPLLQQFISFNSNSSINTNPYIFSFSRNNLATGNGFVFGSGFGVNSNSSNDGVSLIDITNYNVSFRIGYERKFLQRQKWIPFWGIETALGGVYNKVHTESFSVSGTKVTTESTRLFIGPSLRGGVEYALTKHILLGTEFFFNAQIAFRSTSSSTGQNSEDVVPLDIGFHSPTALFLVFRW